MQPQRLPNLPASPFTLPVLDSQGRVTVSFAIDAKELTYGGKPLGEGAYGKVYQGTHARFGDVAVKVINMTAELSEEMQRKVRKEASVMIGIRSRYLVEFRGICLNPCLIVMELMPGGNLLRLLHSSAKLSWTARFRMAADIALGLQHLHQFNVLHCDLKSLNVLLDKEGRAKLSDFGLSSFKTSGSFSNPKGGTDAWMAPEVLGGGEATQFSDVYGLGMLLWELATRRVPYQKAGRAVTGWILSGKQEEILDTDNCPEPLAKIIKACWHKEPTQRPTAAEVAKQLEGLWRAELSKSADAGGVPDSLPEALSALGNLSSRSSSAGLNPLSGSLFSKESASAEQGQVSVELSTLSYSHDSKSSSDDSKLLSAVPNVALFGRKADQQEEKLRRDLRSAQQELSAANKKVDEFNKRNPGSDLSLDKRQEKERLFQAAEACKGKVAQLTPKLEAYVKDAEEKLITRYQDPLILACERGDLGGVKKALAGGADPTQPNMKGKFALPAAIWGMNKECIEYLNSRLGSNVPTWQACVAHNKKHYGRTFYIPEDPKACEEWLSKDDMEKETKDWLVKQSIEWREEKITQYKEEERLVTSDAYDVMCCVDPNINFDFYVMPAFDSEVCKEIKGNAVILTDINTVYFVMSDKVVLKDEKPVAVEAVNRQNVPVSTSDLPIKVTSPREAINKIIGESLRRGKIYSGSGRMLASICAGNFEDFAGVLAVPGLGCTATIFTAAIYDVLMISVGLMCCVTAPFRVCCDDAVIQCLAPAQADMQAASGLMMAFLCHSCCCIAPCKASFLQKESVPYETSVQRVAMPEVAGQTLFGEAAAIRDIQQRLGISTSRELSGVPARMDMQ